RHMVGNEPFAVILPDDMVLSRRPCLSQMLEAYERVGGNILGVTEVPRDKTHHYGVVDIDHEATSRLGDARLVKASGLVEKPKPEEAPSTLSIIGRYILQPEIFKLLDIQKPGAGGEVQLTDAINALIPLEEVYGYKFEGTRYDCGGRVGYVLANVAFALHQDGLGERIRAGLMELLKD
ncbi:MAG: UTP--glucose-1-phosphate uridylyltransferase, partial [Alphaproteobacteria bacterium]|nr:UTP--glucose-1-phosphate uridylyltransferase [Alphaproteobacteria bacterium]